jgi:hypothetical protein
MSCACEKLPDHFQAGAHLAHQAVQHLAQGAARQLARFRRSEPEPSPELQLMLEQTRQDLQQLHQQTRRYMPRLVPGSGPALDLNEVHQRLLAQKEED